VQLDAARCRPPFPSLGGLGAHRSRLKPPVLAGRTGPSDMLAPTAESRRELSTAVDDCVSSQASVPAWRAHTPACRADCDIAATHRGVAPAELLPSVSQREMIVKAQPATRGPPVGLCHPVEVD
jgi:hypothetical protein